jgi:hypothetical protein
MTNENWTEIVFCLIPLDILPDPPSRNRWLSAGSGRLGLSFHLLALVRRTAHGVCLLRGGAGQHFVDGDLGSELRLQACNCLARDPVRR